MEAGKIWAGLLAKRLLWVAALCAVASGVHLAWQRDLLSAAGFSALAKSVVWTPGQSDATDVPGEGSGRPAPALEVPSPVARASSAGRTLSVGTIFEPSAVTVAPPPLPIALDPITLDKETTCLARAIYHEAAHDPVAVRIAIAHVAMVRQAQSARQAPHNGPGAPPSPGSTSAAKASPGGASGSMCAVVYNGVNSLHGCLFVATCRGSGAAQPTGEAWREAQQIASDLMSGKIDALTATRKPELAEATHFHTTGERPGWLGSATKVAQVGRFVFLNRKPVEPVAVAGNREPPVTEAVLVKEDVAETPPPPTVPRKPLQRAEQASDSGAAKAKADRTAETWITGGQ
jgi:Cell Wall Hydrolase